MFKNCQKPPVYFPTVTGSICSFNSQYADLPLKSHSVEVVATQSGSGTPSPSNPRPISGYSAINISHSDADTSTPTVYTIQIGSTVYGGEYDAKTGVLTVTHKAVVFDGSNDEDWDISNSGTVSFYYSISNAITDLIGTTNQSICNLFAYATIGNTGSTVGFFITSGRVVRIRNESEMSIADWKTWLSNNPVTIVYPLATPITIQLPTCLIDTLLGENNVWADTGNTTLEYLKAGR